MSGKLRANSQWIDSKGFNNQSLRFLPNFCPVTPMLHKL
jgi:hypothetical protein